jgi:hypothetical protein
MANPEYKITKCERTATGEVFYRVYEVGRLDGLSDHATMAAARNAVQRYEAADKRHAAINQPLDRSARRASTSDEHLVAVMQEG